MLVFNLKASPLVGPPDAVSPHWMRGLLGWPAPVYGRLIPGTTLQLGWACPTTVRLRGFELFVPSGSFITSVRSGERELLAGPEQVEPGLSSLLQITGAPLVAPGAYITIAVHLPTEDPCNG